MNAPSILKGIFYVELLKRVIVETGLSKTQLNDYTL